jgi:hypothetical protein
MSRPPQDVERAISALTARLPGGAQSTVSGVGAPAATPSEAGNPERGVSEVSRRGWGLAAIENVGPASAYHCPFDAEVVRGAGGSGLRGSISSRLAVL